MTVQHCKIHRDLPGGWRLVQQCVNSVGNDMNIKYFPWYVQVQSSGFNRLTEISRQIQSKSLRFSKNWKILWNVVLLIQHLNQSTLWSGDSQAFPIMPWVLHWRAGAAPGHRGHSIWCLPDANPVICHPAYFSTLCYMWIWISFVQKGGVVWRPKTPKSVHIFFSIWFSHPSLSFLNNFLESDL